MRKEATMPRIPAERIHPPSTSETVFMKSTQGEERKNANLKEKIKNRSIKTGPATGFMRSASSHSSTALRRFLLDTTREEISWATDMRLPSMWRNRSPYRADRSPLHPSTTSLRESSMGKKGLSCSMRRARASHLRAGCSIPDAISSRAASTSSP